MEEKMIPCVHCGEMFPEAQAPNSRCCEDCYDNFMEEMQFEAAQQEVQSKLEAGW